VLRRIRSLEPENPFVNARLVEVFARERNPEEAIAALHQVFFAPTEKSEWPADFAWHTAQAARFSEKAFHSVHGALEQGKRPTPHALTLWASYALERAKTDIVRREPPWRTWIPHSGARKVLAVLKGESGASWMDGRYRARLLCALCDHGYGGLVVRYWRRHREEVESDLDCWAQTVRAVIACGEKRLARKLMAGWRGREAVGLWLVASYTSCFNGLRPGHLLELRGLCTEALAVLPHDPCARYIAHVGAEASALLGDTQGFLATWKRDRRYFDGECSEEEWFPQARRHLLEDIPRMAGLLEEDQRFQYGWILWRLRWGHLWRTIRESRVVRALEGIPFVVWWLLVLGTAAIVANL
jgi:hypothetical protein